MASIAAPPETTSPTSPTRRPPGQLAGNAVGLPQVLPWADRRPAAYA